MKTIPMPSFGADMAEGTLIEWQVKPGDRLSRGQVVAVIETNKGAIELDLFEEGIVDACLLGLGQTARVGTPILRLRDPAEAASATPQDASVPVSPQTAPAGEALPAHAEAAAPAPGAPLRHAGFLPASPAARAWATTLGLPLASIHGSGPDGAILLRDIEASQAEARAKSAERLVTAPASGGGLDMAAMRAAISATVSRAKKEIPHYYLSLDVCLGAVQDQLTAGNAQRAVEDRLLLAAPLLCAIARTLSRHPELNGSWRDDQYQGCQEVNLANAISLRGGGLLMPVIPQAQQLDAPGMMAWLNRLVDKARHGNLRHSELNGATCTVSNLGERGADRLLAVIYPPQVAILGLGRPRQAPWVLNGQLTVAPVITISLSADHRVSDGHQGALFLHELDKLLQQPEVLWTPLTPSP
ncbi:dihydrolipoamide acetyltransferase family protein [Pseudaeromonas paramecii]|uniref:Dihydrolipoamide acetyltransferase component of pyruvate dehydrogenase complex n=1 Tax=Pseudaeromonas paramecii TaxID=2138166 RepID=A0ABP8Q1N7_9GAMM